MKLKIKIGFDTWKRRIRLTSKVQGSRFERHCFMGNRQGGRCQGRLHRRNATSYYPKRYLEDAQEEFALCAEEQEENGYVVQTIMACQVTASM